MELSAVLPTTKFAIGKALVPVIHFVRPIKAFCIGSELWVLEVLCCLYWHSFCQTDHRASTLWWMVIGVNWLTLCQECRRAVFWARYCSSCTLRSFFALWKISWSVKLMTLRRHWSYSSRVYDLGRVSEWCDLWVMKLNASKTKAVIVSRSSTMHPQSPPINYWRNWTEGVWWPCYIGSGIWFQDDLWEHLHLVSRAASERLGILRKSWRVFHDRSLLGRCFLGFVLPVLEYCSAMWCSADDTHLKLVDHAVSCARFLTGGEFECDIAHRISVAVLCMLYEIRCNPMHQLRDALPGSYVPVRVRRGALVAHRYTYAPPRCRTSQYSRTFVPFSVSLWNDLADPVFDGVGLAGFKSRAKAFLLE